MWWLKRKQDPHINPVGHHLRIYGNSSSIQYFSHYLASVSVLGFVFILFCFVLCSHDMWQRSAGTETCRGGLVVSFASAFVFLKESTGLSQVNFKVWFIGFLTLHCHMPPGRLTEAQFLGVPNSSELVFCFYFVCVGASQWAQTLWAFSVIELSLFKSRFWMKWVSFKMQLCKSSFN